MGIVERLNEDMKQAMKDQDKFRLSVIRMLRSAIKNAEIDKRKPLGEDEAVEVLSRELKLRQDSLQDFERGGRADLADNIRKEIAVIREYLPRPLSEEELTELVERAIRDTGASSKADIGKVMAVLMPQVKGRADGRHVQRLVQERLS
ncbi:MAG: aspartyl-tRNA amidotransferase [Candidatus Reconcilbacillus cellulovorans]|uniref:Aspartyl-tRNA amidotransferase n=1 Tax=Candidatus Reconcilbacillus cellulovorans TaxID=1906605 RepID=A0A2A6E0K4_9BACL|nr:MAG: aspartyl-tRNA amidotransferase [Candidatus Reconcilbacillus cellulovorans]